MPNPVSVGLSGLLAFQKAISTVSNNIANASTPGYSRQRAELVTLPSAGEAGVYIGQGTSVNAVTRASANFLNAQILTNQASYSELEAFFSQASQIDKLLVEEGASLSQGLQDFFNSIDQINAQPTDLSVRNVFMAQADMISNRFHALNKRMTGQADLINQEIGNIVGQVNLLASNIADLNARIVTSVSGAPELEDQRDVLIGELSKYVSVNTLAQSNGALNVTIGTGQSLVINAEAMPLSTQLQIDDPRSLDIVLSNGSASTVVTDNIFGGDLGGYLQVRDEMINPILNSIGQIALGLADRFNQQNQLGMTLDGSIGTTFFDDINSQSAQINRAIISSANTGSAVLAVAITDTSTITNSDYTLDVTGVNSYALTRESDGTVTTYTSFPIAVDGLSIDIDSGAVNTGDRFKIVPTRNASAEINLNITDGRQIAVAAPVRTLTSNNNIGTGVISDLNVIDTSNGAFATPGQLTPPVRVEFLSTNSYQLVNATTSAVLEGPIAYTPGAKQALFPTPGALDYGYRIDIAGNPEAGDSFTIEYNTGGFTDNRNGRLISDIQSLKHLEGGTKSFADSYSGAIAFTGGKTSQVSINLQASEILLEQSKNEKQALTGVNLDEEAAKLLQLQQAYQAAGQVISIASRMLDVVFDIILG